MLDIGDTSFPYLLWASVMQSISKFSPWKTWRGVVTHGSEGFQSFGLGWQALWEAMTFFLLSFRNSASVSPLVFTNPATNSLFLQREASVFWFWTKKEPSIVPWPLKWIHNFLHTLGHHILSRIYRLKWILVNGNSFSSLRNSCLACLHFKGNLVLGSHKLFFFKICWLIKVWSKNMIKGDGVMWGTGVHVS